MDSAFDASLHLHGPLKVSQALAWNNHSICLTADGRIAITLFGITREQFEALLEIFPSDGATIEREKEIKKGEAA